MFSKLGDTALVLLVPEAESIVGEWRARFDSSAEEGMPAHITVLYPFVPAREIDGRCLEDLGRMCDRHEPIHIEFRAMGAFPGVVWIDPASEACRRLLEDARATWPDRAPYGKANLAVVPHLTVTDGAGDADAERARASVLQHLPLRARVAFLSLMAFDGSTWVVEQRFALGAGTGDLRRWG